MVEILFLNISSFKTQSFDLFCFSILTCNGANDWRNATSSNLDLFLSKAQKQDSTRKLRFYFDQMFHKSYSIIRINRLCCGKLKTSSYSSGPTWGPTKQNWENLWGSFSRVIQLGFLRSLVSSLRCEANQINSHQLVARRETHCFQREPLKCWGTCCRARPVQRDIWLRRTRAPKWEHGCTAGRYDAKDRHAQ